jgi:hypothetical protein
MTNRLRMHWSAAAALVVLSPGAAAQGVPVALAAPAGQTQVLVLQARGVQIYVGQAVKGDPARCEWVFKAPEADLFNAQGRPAGRHYAGPTWEAPDGSKVVGEVKAKDTSRSAGSIPWLLLSAKANSGPGVFSRVTSIQRLDTSGGAAPAGAAEAGKEVRVAYTATYVFFEDGAW